MNWKLLQSSEVQSCTGNTKRPGGWHRRHSVKTYPLLHRCQCRLIEKTERQQITTLRASSKHQWHHITEPCPQYQNHLSWQWPWKGMLIWLLFSKRNRKEKVRRNLRLFAHLKYCKIIFFKKKKNKDIPNLALYSAPSSGGNHKNLVW